jgi:hypothetical protein
MGMIHRKVTIFFVFCLTVIFLAIGCTAARMVTKDITGEGGRLKKKIAFLPISNKPGYEGTLSNSARGYIKAFVERSCDDLVFVDSQESRDLLAEITRFPSGQIDNLALAERGRALGLNVVLEESISGLEGVQGKCGTWGFRDRCMLVKLSVSVRGYDIESGAVLFEEVLQKMVEVSEPDWRDIKEGREYRKELADRLLAETLSEISKRTCERVGDTFWKGYITYAYGNTFALTAGEDVGLVEGDIVEVFGMGEAIKGHAGQFYLVSGPKVGELRIISVHRNWAEAEATGDLGDDFPEVSHVKLKQ